MDSTSISLLRRLQEPNQDTAWERFVELYAPLIFRWGRNKGLSNNDASDLVQEVMSVIVRKLPEFQNDPKKRFRAWLRTIAVNKVRDFQRRKAVRPATGVDEQILTVTVASDVDLFDEDEYRKFIIGRARELLRHEFEPTTWQAFWKLVTEDRSAADVGRELKISKNAARVAKCRVVRRLREEIDGLID